MTAAKATRNGLKYLTQMERKARGGTQRKEMRKKDEAREAKKAKAKAPKTRRRPVVSFFSVGGGATRLLPPSSPSPAALPLRRGQGPAPARHTRHTDTHRRLLSFPPRRSPPNTQNIKGCYTKQARARAPSTRINHHHHRYRAPPRRRISRVGQKRGGARRCHGDGDGDGDGGCYRAVSAQHDPG